MSEIFNNVDWAELRNQKEILYSMAWEEATTPEQEDAIEGVLNLLDHFMDFAVSEGYESELMVFGKDIEVG